MAKKTDYIEMSAQISSCQKYRYTLYRCWDREKPTCAFVMLNPSTADASKDDATLTRCVGFAQSWGYGSLYLANICPFRARKPKDLLTWDQHVSAEERALVIESNQAALELIKQKAGLIVAGWGTWGVVFDDWLDRTEKALQGRLHALKRTACKAPSHPLYLKGSLLPFKYG